ncbi:molybdenum cofactor guanylyltransferase [Helicobacter turcicus]|uniref:Molybdenum cofactor guanylyltransferase n=1 Tax=Helicobacter turcicus TaxID=2867412 RepID=A0ABS7JNP4_9HELI|nr:molybdenum cofactor guanylyltransferase [Helicobacter turcicus]MBX7491017.1 molybdenum cofactor guanylyltransferase [Helicobacter turcicus]MBX7545856.1 molybdenum cofactor guanylyltransferase [Helicobacter turcicus]
MTKFTMPCVVLSGGMGERMGGFKQNLPFLDSTLANFQAKRLKNCFEYVYFSAKVPIVNVFGVETILDSNCAFQKDSTAPIFGLYSALKALQSDIFVLSIDAPFFACDSVTLLMEQASKIKSVFAKNTKIHPLLGIYRFSALDSIEAQILKRNFKLMDLLKLIGAEFIEVSVEQTRNLNTKQDYEEACRVVGFKG